MGSITGTYKAEILVLPPILPNEYMFQKFADKGKSKAEIFAYVSREIMSKASGRPTIEVQSRDKALYKDFMTGKTNEIEVNGKTFTAPPVKSLFPWIKPKKKRTEKPKE